MQIARFGLLAALLLALLSACSQPAQTPPAGEGAPTSAPTNASAAGDSAYPGPRDPAAYPAPGSAAYPGAAPTEVVDSGPLVIPEPSSDQVGVISGVLLRITEDGSRVPITRGILYLGNLLQSEGGREAMVGVNKGVDPSAPVNSRGEFVFADVPAGRYGLMFDNFEGTVLLHDPETSGNFIIEVTGGQKQELGELAYPLPE